MNSFLAKVRRYSNAHWLDAPPHIRFCPLNFLGYQPLRYIFEHLKYSLRYRWKTANPSISSKVQKDGIATINSFLPCSVFSELQMSALSIIEREKSRDGQLVSFSDDIATRVVLDSPYLQSCRGLTDLDAWFIWDNIKRDDLISFAEDIYRSNYLGSRQFKVELEMISVQPDGSDHFDHNTMWHVDRHFNCVKMFLFLNDHSKVNGTYEYTPLPNYSLLSRIWYEYCLSCRTYLRYLRFFNVQKSVSYALRKPRVTDHEIGLLNIYPNPIEEPSNTLVISNNISFHRRGIIQPGNTRFQINLDFYNCHRNIFMTFVKYSFSFLDFLRRQYKNTTLQACLSLGMKNNQSVQLASGCRMFSLINEYDSRFNSMVLSGNDFAGVEFKLFSEAAKQSSLIFDIGANFGSFTFGSLPLPPSVEAFCFEPNVKLNKSIRKTISTNKPLTQNVSVYDYAVSDFCGSTTFYVNSNWSGSSSLESKFINAHSGQIAYDVQTLTLDQWHVNYGIDVRNKAITIKIDVEGHDLSALFGARQILEKCSHYLIIIELDYKQFESSRHPKVEFLKELFIQSDLKYIISSDSFSAIPSFDVLLHALCKRSPRHLDLVLASKFFATPIHKCFNQ